MAVVIKKPATGMPETNFMEVRTQVIEPIDLLEGILTSPTDLTAEFAVEEADGNQYSFYAWRKKAGYKGAVEWDKNDRNVDEKLDKLELAQKTIIIDGEIIAGTQVKAIDLQSKGGKAIKTLDVNTQAVIDDLRWGIYRKVRKGLQDTMQTQEIVTDDIDTLIQGLQDIYEVLIKTQMIKQNAKEGWAIYLKEKTFDTIFGLNKTFTGASVNGGINNTMLQGIVWGLDETTKKSIKFHGISFKIIDDINFEDGDGKELFKAFFMNTAKFGRIVYIADGVQGGIWTYPINTDTKDDLIAFKGKGSVQFVPHVYVYDETNNIGGDKSPFAWGLVVKKEDPKKK